MPNSKFEAHTLRLPVFSTLLLPPSVTLQDLSTQAIFFANPRTGECSWQPPNGVYVLPIPPTGQWWCLNDHNRSNLPYFYHTASQETRWTKPEVPLIIPLASIQMNTLGAPPSKSFQRRRSASALAAPPTSTTNSTSSSLNSFANSSPSKTDKMRSSKTTTTTTRAQKSSAPPSTTHGRNGVHQQSFSAAAQELKKDAKADVAVSSPMEVRNNSSGSGKGSPEKGSGGGVMGLGRRIRERAMSGPLAGAAAEATNGGEGRPRLERLRTDLKGRNIGEPSLDLGESIFTSLVLFADGEADLSGASRFLRCSNEDVPRQDYLERWSRRSSSFHQHQAIQYWVRFSLQIIEIEFSLTNPRRAPFLSFLSANIESSQPNSLRKSNSSRSRNLQIASSRRVTPKEFSGGRRFPLRG